MISEIKTSQIENIQTETQKRVGKMKTKEQNTSVSNTYGTLSSALA